MGHARKLNPLIMTFEYFMSDFFVLSAFCSIFAIIT